MECYRNCLGYKDPTAGEAMEKITVEELRRKRKSEEGETESKESNTMREILFRGKAINRVEGREYRTNYKNGDWVYGLVTRSYDEHFENLPAEMTNTDGINNIEVDYKTIGLYTGLTDKNGTKIFEGDIVRHYNSIIDLQRFEIGAIYWDTKKCRFIRTTKSGYCEVLSSGKYEVIGNIHDNPDLLEKM